jgi:hypothetical protein
LGRPPCAPKSGTSSPGWTSAAALRPPSAPLATASPPPRPRSLTPETSGPVLGPTAPETSQTMQNPLARRFSPAQAWYSVFPGNGHTRSSLPLLWTSLGLQDAETTMIGGECTRMGFLTDARMIQRCPSTPRTLAPVSSHWASLRAHSAGANTNRVRFLCMSLVPTTNRPRQPRAITGAMPPLSATPSFVLQASFRASPRAVRAYALLDRSEHLCYP